jgi:homoserine kinase
MLVAAPASSANLGPGFDCLGLALGGLPFQLTDAPPAGDRWHDVGPTHPAHRAFVDAGGEPTAPLWWRSPIPPGRGLGFSGAARVAGAYLAARLGGSDHAGAQQVAAARAGALEGHPDNAAASAFGGLTVSAGGRTVRLDPPEGVEVLVWSPRTATSTDASRRTLPRTVELSDAVFAASRAALWVAAVATGELGLLRTASEDRLHQAHRLAGRPDSAAALAAMRDHPAVLAAWLSGSGPTVAALVPPRAGLDELVARLGRTGRVLRLDTDRGGVLET